MPSGSEFYKTRLGRTFYEGHVPKIIKALQKIGEELEKLNEKLDKTEGSKENAES